MLNYEKLDYLIAEAIKAGANTFAAIDDGAVHQEALRLLEEDKNRRGHNAKPAFRHIDSRLQSLRKSGLIKHLKGQGWVMARTD